MLGRLTRQLRYSARLLARSPVFTLTAVGSLAIGIGANIAIFTVANALLLAPTPGIRDAGRVVDIGRTVNGEGFDTVSYPTFADLRDRASALSGVYAADLEPQPMSLGGDDAARRVYAQLVSANYFDVLGLVPTLGTFFRAGDEQVGVPLRAVVLGHGFWTRQFDARATIVGTEITLNGDRFTVIGVAPKGYQGTTILAPDLWVPLTAHARALPDAASLRGRRNQHLMLGGRLAPDVSLAQAQADLDVLMSALRTEYPEAYANQGLRAMPLSRVPGEAQAFVAPFVGLLMGLVGLVLLVACTNLAGLLLTRATDRSREVAMRLALGAPRRAIVGLLMSETLLVFALGALAGFPIAVALARLLQTALTAVPVPIAVDFSPDWRVVVFAIAITLATGVLSGLAPAVHGIRRSLIGELRRDAASSPRRQRLRRVFIAAQISCCLVLIIAAGLFMRALAAATTVDPGFALAGIEVASVDLALGGYSDDAAVTAATEIRDRLAALPGVASVGTAAMVPLSGGGLGLGGLRLPGATDPNDFITADWNVVSPEFLPTVSLALVRGRHFSAADRSGAPEVAIINEELANRAWPGQDPIGRVFENGDFRPGGEQSLRRLTVVGVARDTKYRWLGDGPRNFIYVPLAQNPMTTVNYFLRRTDAAQETTLAPAVRGALQSFDPQLPLIHMASFRSYADVGLLPQRLAASLAGALGAVALVLAAIGVYGVTAYAVASRTREIGVRLALGADARRVVREALTQGARITAIGAVVGVGVALAVTHLATDLLFGISPVDLPTFTLTTGALVAIGLLATYLPARRAARVSPVVALRAE
jgi:predicted permease